MQASAAFSVFAGIRPNCRRVFAKRLPANRCTFNSSRSYLTVFYKSADSFHTSNSLDVFKTKYLGVSGSTGWTSPPRRSFWVNASETEVPASSEDQEGGDFNVVTFYWLTEIEDPHALVTQHKDFLKTRDCKGRIYINNQGINAQLSGLGEDALEYAKFVMQDSRFSGCEWTQFPVACHQFPKLNLRYKPNLVSLNGGTQHLPLTDPLKRAVKITPEEWREKLKGCAEEGAPGIVLDVRNDYEWDAGHFTKTARPSTERFRDTELDAPGEPLHGIPKDTPIFMYCTGGIRCDVYSSVLKERGFQEMYTLKGGVQNYLKEQGREMWDGELFVFDDRLATPNMPVGEEEGMDSHQANRRCFCCTEPAAAPPHRNCANVDCNRLFLVCPSCLQLHEAHCSTECLESAQRSRPLVSTGHYTKWHKYANGTPSVRGDGRARRRRARRERQQEREYEEAMLAIKTGKVDWDEKPKNRYAQRRLQRRIELAKKLMDMGELPEEANGKELLAATFTLQETFGKRVQC